MYPEYLKIAKHEGNKLAAWSFDVANKVEQIHANLYAKAIEALKNKKALAETDYNVCSVCGNTVDGNLPEKCPICGAPKNRFSKTS